MNDKPETPPRRMRRPRRVTDPGPGSEAKRSAREFLTDVAIVVVGVLLALAAEQAANTLQWRQKVKILQASLKHELSGNLVNAWESQSTAPCARRYIDALERAILRGDHAQVERLRQSGWPFGLRRWQDNVWSAAMSTAVADHLPQKDLATYASLYTGVQVQRQHQNRMQDAFEDAMVSRFDIGPEARAAQLSAVGRLRSVRNQTAFISGRILADAQSKLGLAPDPRAVDEVRRANGSLCQRFI